ncbi:MAG: type 2 isopentenyl-diphosphate Delta-isomerase [Clostridium sp.]|nr:type 2 isopentenyl-diphosphate Delta-isomerase [Clostridium sp.]
MDSNKKDDHLKLTRKFYKDVNFSDFDNLKYIYHSFPEIGVNDVDIKTNISGFNLNHPFFINAMTGGSDKTKLINQKLAIIARETDTLMASGSLSAALKDKSLENSFKIIRKENPKGIIFANLGAEHSLDNVKKAIEIIDADGIQIHINSIQELIMPEGDRNFKGWLKNIEKIILGLDIPVIVKEVGFGMSSRTIKELVDMGVSTIDISGRGGTNFAKIENYRREKKEYNYLEYFGQSTVESLLEGGTYSAKVDIIASGGIRNPLDVVKSLSLGAKAVGLSAFILDLALELGVDKTIEILESWKYQIKIIMTLLGSKNISNLTKTDVLIYNNLKDYAELRGIDIKKYANRSK